MSLCFIHHLYNLNHNILKDKRKKSWEEHKDKLFNSLRIKINYKLKNKEAQLRLLLLLLLLLVVVVVVLDC